MKLVYDFDFSKAAKKAETLINECVRKKRRKSIYKDICKHQWSVI